MTWLTGGVHYLAQAASPAGVTTATVVTILASAVIVLGGLAALVRAIWKVANSMRDNTLAVQRLTERMDELASSVDGRFDKLLHRVETLERAVSHER